MTSKNILIVDDAAETRLFLKSLTTSLGYVPFDAKSGPDALKILNEHKIDLVLLDILMPNMDGYQLLEHINELRESRNFKVAFLTGIRVALDQKKVDLLRPDEIIHKTVDIQVLKSKIKKLILSEPTTPFKVNRNSESLPPQPSEKNDSAIKKTEFMATLTNMPFILDVKLAFTNIKDITFTSPIQFKKNVEIIFLSAESSLELNLPEKIQAKVKGCVEMGDKFIVELDIMNAT